MLVLVILASLVGEPSTCGGRAADWPSHPFEVLPECDLTVASPDERREVRIDREGGLHFSADGRALAQQPWTIRPPSQLLWSPSSLALYVNDGEGSGMSSTLRIFRIVADHVDEDRRVGESVLQRFRAERHCEGKLIDQSVWGFGWSPGGSLLYAFVQDGPHYPCRRPAEFECWIVRAADGKIVENVPEKAARRRFRTLPNMIAGEN